MKRSISILLVTVLLFSVVLAGCSKKSELLGKWTLTSAEADGKPVPEEQLEQFGMKDYTIEFKAKGKAELKAGANSIDADYKEKDGEITVSEPGKGKSDDDLIFKLKDGKLSGDMDGVTMVFEKK